MCHTSEDKSFSVWLRVKNLPANVGDVSSIPGWGRSPEGGNGNLLQYSCLGNRMDRGAWQATVRGVPKELDTTQRLNNNQILKDLGAAFLLS